MTRRSLATRRPDTSSALRPNVPGYIDFNGGIGEYLSTTRTVLATATTIEFAIRVRLDALGSLHRLCGWLASGAGVIINSTTNTLSISAQGSSGTIGAAVSTAAVPSQITSQPVWLRSLLTVSTATCSYWYSLDQHDEYSQLTWTAIGTPAVGTNAGTTVTMSNSTTVLVGNREITALAATTANVYAFYEIVNGTVRSWFRNSDIPSSSPTVFMSSGGGQTWTLTGAQPYAFVPTQSFDGALRGDFSFDAPATGLDEDALFGVVDAGYDTVRVSYQPVLILPHPTLGDYDEAMVVRSTAGFPVTNLDGSQVMRYVASDPALSGGWASVLDSGLSPGQWYYYTLFVRYESTTGWYKLAEQAWLNPRQHGYPDRIWFNFPNYYRRIDNSIWIFPGYLRRLCDMLGYEFDTLRTWAETVGDVWDFEKLSGKLLPEAGDALGLLKESANGDRRLRTLAGNIVALRKKKGTQDGVEGYIAALTGYPTRVYDGLNLLHRQQHAEWLYSFAAQDGSAVANTDNHPGWASNVFATNYGQLSRQVAASNEGSTISMADGTFYLRISNTTGLASAMNLYYGHANNGVGSYIPITGGHQYKFSTAIKASGASTVVQFNARWFSEYSLSPVGSDTIAFVTVGTTWVRTTSAAVTAPATAKYCQIGLTVPATMPINATVNIWRPLFCDLAWRPYGIPTLQKYVPLSSVSGTDLGTFIHQTYYEAPREVKINIYPNRANLALNSDFLLNNLPAGAWGTYDPATYAQLPIAYDTYADIIDAPPDWEVDYADMASGLYPLTAVAPTIIWDTAGSRIHVNKSTAPFAYTLMHSYFDATNLGGMSAAVGAFTDIPPTTDDPYLDGNFGTVTTTDLGNPPDDGIMVFRIRGPVSGAEGTIAGQLPGAPNNGWGVRRCTTVPENLAFVRSSDGTTIYGSWSPVSAPTGYDEYLALSWDWNPANLTRRMVAYRSLDGINWSALPPKLISDTGLPFDSTGALRIGGSSTTSSRFYGRIYWAELRTGLDPTGGNLLWRFDAADYPGTGTAWTDTRGHTWTMSTPGVVITPKNNTKMTLAFEWYTDNDVVYRINTSGPVGLTGEPLRTVSPEYTLTTNEARYEVVNAVPPANARYGRLFVMISNTIANDTSLSWALIEDAPFPGTYFNGDFNDGAGGDFFYAIGRGYTGGAHLSPSVYYQQFRAFVSGVGGADKLTTLMPRLLPFRRTYKIVNAATGLYNAVT